ncbi:MAG: M1 family aminopeptidase [Thermoplasmatales archaeon]
MLDQEFKPFALQGYSPTLEREKQFEVKKTVIDVKINFEEKAVEGKVELHLKINGLKQDHLDIDAQDMEVFNVSVRGVPVRFETRKNGIVVFGDFNPFSEYTVTITYKAYPTKGAYFVEDEGGPQFWTHGESEDNHSWFPCFDYPNDRSEYEIRVTVPPEFKVISNGKLLSKVEGEFTTYTFKEDFKFPSYLVSIVAGKFVSYEQEWNGIKISSNFLPKFADYADRAFRNTPDMMQFISEKTGIQYPYSKYDQTCVTNFIMGGMENITATTLTDRVFHDEIAHLDYQSERLLCHELAHQWFGDYVTCKDWSHAWLNEGFATYMAMLYVERFKGHDDFLAEIESIRETYLKEFRDRYGRAIVEKNYKEPEELFDRHLYQKASLFLRYLNYLLGDRVFWAGVRKYLETNRMRSVSTEDFRAALSSVSGLSLEQTFHQFLELPGHPEIEVQESFRGGKVIITINQSGRVFALRIPVRLYYEDRKLNLDVFINEKVTQLEFEGKDFRAFSIDPEDSVLATYKIGISRDALRYILKNGESVIERARAASELRSYGFSEIPFLESAFWEEKSWYVKSKIAESISLIGGDKASEALLRMIEDTDYNARREVVSSIANTRDPRFLQKLAEVFESEKGYKIRSLALTSAVKVGKERSKELLLKGLGVPSYDSWIRTAAIQALGELNDLSVVSTLKEYLKKDYDWQTRAAAVSALSKLYWEDRSIGSYFLDALRDDFPTVRSAAVESIKATADTKLLNELRNSYEREKNGFVRRAMREAFEMKEVPLPSEFLMLREEISELRNRIAQLESKEHVRKIKK